jgi:hypothetical protein
VSRCFEKGAGFQEGILQSLMPRGEFEVALLGRRVTGEITLPSIQFTDVRVELLELHIDCKDATVTLYESFDIE